MPRPRGFLVDGRYLKAQRENAALTQDQLAASIQLTRSVIQKAERGGPLAPATIQKISKYLGCAESTLIVAEDWNRNIEERVFAPFRPEEAPKIGNIWMQSREMLYEMPPLILQGLALRNIARVMPAYSPRSLDGERHFANVVATLAASLVEVGDALKGATNPSEWENLRDLTDACYLAAGSAQNSNYEEDRHAADAAFAVAIGTARIAESILALGAGGLEKKDANYWRAMEFATTACHASAHASVYLACEDAFIRAATLDTHDLRNSPYPDRVLGKPLWEGGKTPPSLKLFMDRLIRQIHFAHEIRVQWNRWVRRGFTA